LKSGAFQGMTRRVDPNWMSDPEDTRTPIEGTKSLSGRSSHTTGSLTLVKKSCRRDRNTDTRSSSIHESDDAEQLSPTGLSTSPVGTCRMGRAEDHPPLVVTPTCRVQGDRRGLRVMDPPLCPGHQRPTRTPTVMAVADKGGRSSDLGPTQGAVAAGSNRAALSPRTPQFRSRDGLFGMAVIERWPDCELSGRSMGWRRAYRARAVVDFLA